ncbi:MAG: NUDIX hydrolase [Desulfatibacillaceae bacterium]
MSNREVIYEGRVFSVTRDKVTLPNGRHAALEVVRHPGAAAIVPLTEGNDVLLLKQYRHAAGGYIWEIPAGTLEESETALACAKRELVEETGHSSEVWEELTTIIPSPGYGDERITIFLARGLANGIDLDLDTDEVLEVHTIPLKRALEMVRSGEISDAKTVCGLFLASLRTGV